MSLNKTAEEMIKILTLYADLMQVPKRSTRDLSPLEEWLLVLLIDKEKELIKLKGKM